MPTTASGPNRTASDALLDRFHLSRAEFERKHAVVIASLGLPVQIEIFNQSMRELSDFGILKLDRMIAHARNRFQQSQTRKPWRQTARG